MKTIFASLICFSILLTPIFAQDSAPSQTQETTDTISAGGQPTQVVMVEKMVKSNPKNQKKGLSLFQKFYVVLPILLFFIIGLYFMNWLKRDKFKLADALSSDTPSPATDPTSATPPEHPRSSSRLIAFLTGICAITFALCLISYYMYFVIRGLEIPHFENLWTIMASLGIGVVPYASKMFGKSTTQ